MKSTCETDNNGDKFWRNEQRLLHREDGPAIERNYDRTKEYWYHGQRIECDNDEDFQRISKLKAFW